MQLKAGYKTNFKLKGVSNVFIKRSAKITEKIYQVNKKSLLSFNFFLF